jgi:hypothetical protein
MTPARSVGVVAVGYVGAVALGVLAVSVSVATNTSADAQGGMQAFSDMLLFIGVSGLAALIPTGAALYFLRPYRQFWLLVSGLAAGLGATSVAAAIIFQIGRSETETTLAMLSAIAVLRILVAPLCALTFLVSALLSPYRWPRLALLAAMLMEAAVSAYAGVIWFLPLFFDRR